MRNIVRANVLKGIWGVNMSDHDVHDLIAWLKLSRNENDWTKVKDATGKWLKDHPVNILCDSLPFMCQLPKAMVENLLDEVERLKRGNFTKEEFENLCINEPPFVNDIAIHRFTVLRNHIDKIEKKLQDAKKLFWHVLRNEDLGRMLYDEINTWLEEKKDGT
jgi:uncharacterized protein YpuA (DUF1002 family)